MILSRHLKSLTTFLTASLFFGGSAFAQDLYGTSEQFNFSFGLQSPWCAAIVKVNLDVGDEAGFSQDGYGLQKRLKRLLEHARARCPRMGRLEIRGISKGRVIHNAEYSAMTQWFHMPREVLSDLPQCAETLTPAQCERLGSAYLRFQKMTDHPFFSDVILTSFIDPGPADLSWRDGSIVGSMVAMSPADVGNASVSAIADASIAAAASRCTQAGGTPSGVQGTEKATSALRSFFCTTGKGAGSENIIVLSADERWWVFYVGGDPAPSGPAQWARKLYERM